MVQHVDSLPLDSLERVTVEELYKIASAITHTYVVPAIVLSKSEYLASNNNISPPILWAQGRSGVPKLLVLKPMSWEDFTIAKSHGFVDDK